MSGRCGHTLWARFGLLARIALYYAVGRWVRWRGAPPSLRVCWGNTGIGISIPAVSTTRMDSGQEAARKHSGNQRVQTQR
jgi:hypothetical protein